ncbi:nuclear transport factor 2 family protein [Microbacterium sp. MC2]
MSTTLGFDDWRAITDVIARYARYADERRFADMARLFTADGRMLMFRPGRDVPSQTAQGRPELTAAFGVLTDFAVTSHVLAPSSVEIDGGTAKARTTCVSHHITEGEGGRVRFTLCDRYDDTLVREGECWLFRERRKHTDWTERVLLR